ncbi:MAG: uroporphyrinogen decarboxylase family protein [Candidatus Delongbacteria bacterium]
MRENLLELNRKVIKGASDGKIIWQPRIGAYFDDREFRGEPYDEPYAGLDRPDVYRKIGCSDRLYYFNACVRAVYRNNITIRIDEIDQSHFSHTFVTPKGEIKSIYRRNSSNPGYYPEKWFVTCEDDLRLLMYIEESTDYVFDRAVYDEYFLKYADLGLPALFFPRVSIQKLFHEYMGIEETFYALQDYPDTVEEYFKVLSSAHDRFMDMFVKTPFEWLNFGDNIHCGLLPPELFRKYVLPEYQHRNERLHKHGIFTNSHWDGDVKSILPLIQETGLDGIEAITPIPQGDVTLKEAKKYMKDVFLMDGIAALLFTDLYSIDELKAQVMECIELFAPKLVLGISDELPSTGSLDRVKYVQEIVDEFNSRI